MRRRPLGSQGHGAIRAAETILPGAGRRTAQMTRSASPTRVANISPSPGRRSVWTSSSTTAVLHVMQAVLNAPVVAEQPEQFLRSPLPGTSRLVSRYQRSRLTSPDGYVHALLLHHRSPASPREIPTHPGCSRPVRHRSRCAVSRSRPLFPQGLRLRLPRFLPGKTVGQRRQHRRLIPFDPHQVVSSVADYGLAQVPRSA